MLDARNRDFISRHIRLKERVRRLETRKPILSASLPNWVDIDPSLPWVSEGAQMYVDMGRVWLRGRLSLTTGSPIEGVKPIKDSANLLPAPYRPNEEQQKALIQDPPTDGDYPDSWGDRDDLFAVITSVRPDGTWDVRSPMEIPAEELQWIYLLDGLSWRVA